MAILVGFAFVVGRLSEDRIRGDFREELQMAAGQLAFQISDIRGAVPGLDSSDLEKVAMADAAAVRVLDSNGRVVVQTSGAPRLGPPSNDVRTVGSLKVATSPVVSNAIGAESLFVQYARDYDELEATIGRLWLFLAAGVLAGAALAALAGFVVASRAMRPVANLTATAREISATRDPSRRVPQPDSGDEVAELARTFDEMLRSLDAARAEREQMIQSQREFVADASHELRTPLTSVLANLELLEASLARADAAASAADAEDRETVESAIRSSRRMSRLVGDLLLLARADAGRSAPRRPCDLAGLARAAVEELAPLAGDHQISLDVERPVAVEGNPDELHRMISNLLDNAVRHTPDQTQIMVRVCRRGDRALLAVSDDGPGLPPGFEEQVFERFARGDGPADRATEGGTGLGLAIVRAVTSSHGGTVEAGSATVGGARFEISLPVGTGLPATAERVGAD